MLNHRIFHGSFLFPFGSIFKPRFFVSKTYLGIRHILRNFTLLAPIHHFGQFSNCICNILHWVFDKIEEHPQLQKKQLLASNQNFLHIFIDLTIKKFGVPEVLSLCIPKTHSPHFFCRLLTRWVCPIYAFFLPSKNLISYEKLQIIFIIQDSPIPSKQLNSFIYCHQVPYQQVIVYVWCNIYYAFLFCVEACVNIVHCNTYFSQNFWRLLIVLPFSLHKAIDALVQNDAVIFSSVSHMG